ncbi:hypothetical protein DPMN_116335 [Dreissena polymorpha]|uniref:Uncharacterized protein n=1 Tax=Dreissena polymorpha TaxID=45954 RepID=A0A9D4KPM8_DREPO|nr:hypothetical protein DPMN_116335 [Dreissena polymorpha]
MRAKISETIGNALARILDDESLTVSKPKAFQNTQGSYSKIAMATDTPVRAIQEFGYKYLHLQLAKGNILILAIYLKIFGRALVFSPPRCHNLVVSPPVN